MHHHTPSLFQGLVALAIMFGIGWGIHLALGYWRRGEDDDAGTE